MDRLDDPENASLSRCYRNLNMKSPFTTHLSILLKEGFLCDVNLKVDTTVIPAHRIILASASKYFKKRFQKETLKDNILDLTLQIEDAEILEVILKYIYQGEVTLSLINIGMLLNVLDHIDIHYLKKHCTQFLFDRLRPVSLFTTWELAWRHNLCDLSNVCLVLCRETLCNLVLRCNTVKYLSIEFIEYIIDLEDIAISFNSAIIIKLFIHWLSYETSIRLSNMERIIKKIIWNKPLFKEQADEIEAFLVSYDEDLQNRVNDFIKFTMLEDVNVPSRDLQASAEIVEKSTESPSQDDVFSEDLAACNEYVSCQEICFGESFNCLHYVAPLTASISNGTKSRIKSNFTIGYQCAQDYLLEENGQSEDFQHQLIDICKSNVPNWSIIVQESESEVIALYCSYSENWYTAIVSRSIRNAIGFLNGQLLCRHERSGIVAYNVKLMNWRIVQSPYPIPVSNEEYVPSLGNSHVAFYTYSGSLYSVYALRHRRTKDFRIIVNEWDLDEHTWDCKISVCPNRQEGFVLSISIEIKTSTDTNVYLLVSATIRRSKLSKESKESTSNEADIKVSMKPNEVFYVYKINMQSFTYEELGYRFSEPSYLCEVPSIILEDRIIFILDGYETIEENFEMAFNSRSQFPIDTLVLYHKMNIWRRVRLSVPLPPFYDLPVRRFDGKGYSAVDVAFFKSFMLLGLHRTPHIFQIAIYDLSRLQVIVLSPLPLAAVENMTIIPIDNHQPINVLTNECLKDVDLVGYHFTHWQLKNWYGLIGS